MEGDRKKRGYKARCDRERGRWVGSHERGKGRLVESE